MPSRKECLTVISHLRTFLIDNKRAACIEAWGYCLIVRELT